MKIAAYSILYRTIVAASFTSLLAAQVQFTVTPNPVVFAAVPAASTQSQTVTITSSVPTPIAVQMPDYFLPFLTVSSVPAATAGNPPTAQFTVTADTHGFAPSVVPVQFLMLVGVPGTSNQIQVPVNVIVTGPLSPLTAAPASLAFAFQTSGAAPLPRTLTITSLTGTAQPYTAAASSSGWLGVSPASGNTAGVNSVNVTINPAGLMAGGYDGAVIVTPVTGNQLIVPVHLDVTAPPQIVISKSSLSFVWQTTTGLPGLPGSQTVSLNASNANSKIFFNVSSTVDPSDPMWLVVTPNNGFTNADVQVALNTQVVSSMSLGKHNGTIFIDAPGATPARQAIQVSFTISNGPLLTVSPVSLIFTMAATGALPPSQTINVASTSSATPINVGFTSTSGGAWANVAVTSQTSPVSSTPAQVQVSISPLAQSLSAQTYTGIVSIVSATDRQDIPVTLTVSNVPILNVSPGSLTFSFQLARSVPADQFFQIASSGSPIAFTAAANSVGGWLKINATPGATLTTPTSLIVSIDRTALLALTPNSYSGAVVLTQANGQTLSLPVTLNVSQNGLAQAFPAQLEFTFQPGDPRLQRKDISVTSTGDPFTFNVAVAGGFWLSALGSTGQTTSANITIQVDATVLPPGVYTGIVTFIPNSQPSVAASPAISVPVKVTVAAGSLGIDKSGLSFIQIAGANIPAPQVLNVTNTAGPALSFSASVQLDNGGNWLMVTPLNGVTPQALTVSIVNTSGLVAGTSYTGAIILQAPGASNSPQVIRVTFVVTPPPVLVVALTPLSFSSGPGAPPAAQSLGLSGSAGGMIYTVTPLTQSGGAWLVVTPANGTLPSLLNVSIQPTVLASLAPGAYGGTIRVDSPGAANSPQTIAVSLVVTASAPAVNTVRNSASYQTGAIAPGEILYIDGAAMGPSTLTVAAPNPNWPTTLANTQVTFDGIPAPLLYVMNDKLTAVVPWAIAGRLSAQLVVKYQNQSSAPLNLAVAAVAPGIYTSDATGSGQGAILNYHPNGTVDVNAPARTIERGGAIAVYGTGAGITAPVGVDGAITPAIQYPSNAKVTALIGGQPMTVLYAGGAPGLLSGVMQVNILIPVDSPTGFQPLVVLVNGVPTQANTMVSIQQ